MIATLDVGEECWAGAITDNEGEGQEQPLEVTARTKQGALRVGDMRDFGDFGSLLKRLRRARGLEAGQAWPDSNSAFVLELTVVAIYGPEDLPVAARRSFTLCREEDRPKVRPRTIDTQQVRDRTERRRVHARMGDYL